MDTTVLDTEKFDSLKELADIQTQIASGRATLGQIKVETDAYLTEREQEVLVRIETVLKESEGALREIGSNRDALQKYGSELTLMGGDLQAILLLFKDVCAKQLEVTGLDDRRLERKAEELVRVQNALKAERSVIEADRAANVQDREWIAIERLKLNDERATLDRAIKRLKEGVI